MAKKVNKTDEQFANVEENLSKAGLYIAKNHSKIIKIVGSIILVITIIIGYNTFYPNLDEENASSEIYIAEFHFQRDSFNIALNGDGQFSGFLSIANKYSNTEVGNIANYYAAICQMNLGSSLDSVQYFENALSSLNNFETDSVNEIISSLAIGLKGDAKMELGDTTEAMNFYKSAATDNANSFTTPYFMMKQARIHELKKEFTLSLEIYNTIKSDYPESKEGINIDKYITSASNR